MKKRTISFLLAVVMILGMAPLSSVSVFAEEEVTRRDYILVEDAAYIDTGYHATGNTRVVMDAVVQGPPEYWFGSLSPWSDDGKAARYYVFGNSVSNLRFGYNETEEYGGSIVPNGHHIIEMDKNVMKVDGVVIKEYTYAKFSSGKSLFLFAVNFWGEGVVVSRGEQKNYCYGCKIYEDDTLVRDFIPYLKDGQAGLYDNVGKQFYGNANIVRNAQGQEIGRNGTISFGSEILSPNADLPMAEKALLTLDFDGELTISQDLTITANPCRSAISIADGRNVTIKVNEGVTLSVKGGDAKKTEGAGAGILVPEHANLTLTGKGTVIAYGGNAANGENGGNGDSGERWYSTQMYGASGGPGGYGGGGGGAAIGTAGGNGGLGGAYGAGAGFTAKDHDSNNHKQGGKGNDGSASAKMGTLTIDPTLILFVKGGLQGKGGTGGTAGEQGFDFGSGWENNHTAGGGGGGGGGQGGGQGAEFGTGGQGGGGGAGGNGGGVVYTTKSGFYCIPSYGGLGGGITSVKDLINPPVGAGGVGGAQTKTVKDYASDRKDLGVWSGYIVYSNNDGGAGGAAGVNKYDYTYEELLPATTTGNTIGKSGKTMYYYVRANTECTASEAGVSGLTIAEGAVVHIIVPQGITLTCKGGNGSGLTGGGAGIHVPANSTLYLEGNGTVIATGGNAANGAKGGDASAPSIHRVQTDYGLFYIYSGTYYGGNGGKGGNGGGGAGAGIGTPGGLGGAGGKGGNGVGGDIDEDFVNYEVGGKGGNGTMAAAMGTVRTQSSVHLVALGGAVGAGGGQGSQSSSSYSSQEPEHYNYLSAGGAGGGGGGQGGGAGATVGSGGQGGGGGAGGNGAGCIYHTRECCYAIHTCGGCGGGNTDGNSEGGNIGADGGYTYNGYGDVTWGGYEVKPSSKGGQGGVSALHHHNFDGGNYCVECALAEFEIDENHVLTKCNSTNVTTTVPEGVTQIATNAFSNNPYLKTIDLPSTLTTINASAFTGAVVEQINIPDAVEVIAENAFKDCKSLRTVTISTASHLKTIGKAAFSGSGITSIYIPATVTSIGESSFEACRALQTLTFGKGVKITTIPEKAFKDSGITAVEIPAAVETIQKNAFESCTSLITLTFESGSHLKSTGSQAFYLCQKVGPDIVFPASFEVLGKETFRCCYGIKNVSFEEGSQFKTFDEWCFMGDTLNVLHIPRTTNHILTNAFQNLRVVEGVYVEWKTEGEFVTPEEGLTYLSYANTTLYVPHGCKTLYEKADFWKGHQNIVELQHVHEFNGAYKDNGYGTHVRKCKDCDTYGNAERHNIVNGVCSLCGAPEYVVEDGVLTGYNGNSNEIVIPEGVKKIADNLFAEHSLTSVTLPSTLEEIGSSAFADNEGLTKIDIPASVTVIGNKAFENCIALIEVKVNWTTADKIISLESLTFNGINPECKLVVPIGKKGIYNSGTAWSAFKYIEEVPHEHNFAGEYRSNGVVSHSQKCTLCDEYGNKHDHVFENGKCKFCNEPEPASHNVQITKDGVAAKEGSDYVWHDDMLAIIKSGLTISGEIKNGYICVGGTAQNLTIDGLSIEAPGKNAIQFKTYGNLILKGNNSVSGEIAVQFDNGGEISGDGNLTATGHNFCIMSIQADLTISASGTVIVKSDIAALCTCNIGDIIFTKTVRKVLVYADGDNGHGSITFSKSLLVASILTITGSETKNAPESSITGNISDINGHMVTMENSGNIAKSVLITHIHEWERVDGNKHKCETCDEEQAHSDANEDGICDVCLKRINIEPAITGVSLTIGSDIYMNFYMDISNEAIKNGSMTFIVRGKEIKATCNKNKNGTYFACPLTALEMSEVVTGRFVYNGETIEKTYSVVDYIEAILGGGDKYPDEMKILARKIANYGHYAQIYLASIHTNVTIGQGGYAPINGIFGENKQYDVDVVSATTALNTPDKYNVTVTGASNALNLYGTTVYFDSATALNYYVKVTDGTDLTATAVNSVKMNINESKKYNVEIKHYKDDIYIVSVKDIIATEIADNIQVTVNGKLTITGSVLAYCKAVMNKAGQTDEAKNAMAAFYEYYVAANAYKPMHNTLN